MIRKIEVNSLAADLAALDMLLEEMPANDFAGRIGLEERRKDVERRLAELRSQEEERVAAVALYFNGPPVVGSRGIKAEFATEVLASYQDLVSKIWASGRAGELASTGPVKGKQASQLHITEVVHGSFGFLLEELEEQGAAMFPTPLREATTKATELILAFAGEKDEDFERAIEVVPARVFSSVRDFLRSVHKEEAAFRLVEGTVDVSFDAVSLERAYQRAESYSLEEDVFDTEGELLGVIPIAGRFEFRRPGGEIISGKVGASFSESCLERIRREQLVGRQWKARLSKREVKRFGRSTETFILIDLNEK